MIWSWTFKLAVRHQVSSIGKALAYTVREVASSIPIMVPYSLVTLKAWNTLGLIVLLWPYEILGVDPGCDGHFVECIGCRVCTPVRPCVVVQNYFLEWYSAMVVRNTCEVCWGLWINVSVFLKSTQIRNKWSGCNDMTNLTGANMKYFSIQDYIAYNMAYGAMHYSNI